MHLRVSILLWGTASLLIAQAEPVTRYVSTTGEHIHPFTNWAAASTTIQEAVDAALSGDVILVETGRYIGAGNRNLSFQGKDIFLASVEGASNTIIDCEYDGRAFLFESGETTQAVLRGFTICNAQAFGAVYCRSNSNPLIEQCMIISNRSGVVVQDESEAYNSYGQMVYNFFSRQCEGLGGGLVCEAASPVVRETIIADNIAGAGAGGILCLSNANPLIENSSILRNYCALSHTNVTILAYNGPGQEIWRKHEVWSDGGSGGGLLSIDSCPILRNCRIMDNVAGKEGGGILCLSNDSPVVEGCVISGNRCGLLTQSRVEVVAYNGSGLEIYRAIDLSVYGEEGAGGGLLFVNSTPLLRENQIEGNTAGGYGGGVAFIGNESALVENCHVVSNATGYHGTQTGVTVIAYNESGQEIYRDVQFGGSGNSHGGGIYSRDSRLNVTSSHISANTALIAGGGVAMEQASSVSFVASFITDNAAGNSGGGMAISGESVLQIENCVISSNRLDLASDQNVLTIIAYTSGGQEVFRSVHTSVSGSNHGGAIFAEDSVLNITSSYIAANVALIAGGGLALERSSLHLRNSELRGNKCRDGDGGGIHAVSNMIFNIAGCLLENNQGEGRSSPQTTITIIAYNAYDQEVYRSVESVGEEEGAGRGGALYCEGGSPVIERCLFRNNKSGGWGGAASLHGCVGAVFEDCIVTGNVAGLLNLNTITIKAYNPSGEMIYISISSNAWGGGRGGGVLAHDSSVRITRSLIMGNRSGEWGGGLSFLQGSGGTTESSVVMGNIGWYTTYSTNIVIQGGEPIHLFGESYTADGPGAAAYVEGSEVLLANCTIAKNAVPYESNTLCVVSNGSLVLNNSIYTDDGIYSEEGSLLFVLYSCVPHAYPGFGNIIADPQLAGFRLRASSPCIDAGVWTYAPELDVDGEGRWDSPLHPNRFSPVDIGADEFVDVDSDSMADAWEVLLFGSISFSSGGTDWDDDELTDAEEYDAGTHPLVKDTDGDGVPDGWEVRRLLNPLRNDSGEDPDEDGFINAEEFIADTDPLDGEDFLQVVRCEYDYDSQGWMIGWDGRSGRLYRIAESAELQVWSNFVIVAGSGQIQFVTNNPAGLPLYNCFKLTVELP